MGLDVNYVHVETNNVLATSFGAIWSNAHWKILRTVHVHFFRRGDTHHLNDTRPLPDEFEFRRVIYATPPQLTEQVL